VANSGLFVWGDPLPAVGTPYTRGIEVQVLINYPKVDWATNHGDIFSIHGAKCKPDRPHPKGYERCLPSEERVKGGGEWNHYKVTANNGAIKLEVNGKEVSGVSQCNPRKGYLALESEGAECHFKNLKIKELPSTNPKPAECAKVAEGFVSIFDGLDLNGWKAEEGAWKVAGGHLKATGKGELVSEKKYGRFELVFDWKMTNGACEVAVGGVSAWLSTGGAITAAAGEQKTGARGLLPNPKGWNRTTLTQDGKSLVLRIGEQRNVKIDLKGKPEPGPVVFKAAEGLEIMNVFVRELKEKK
jgi:hypothetical protein